MSESQYKDLQQHLYPGDGLEAVALLLCGRAVSEDSHILSCYKVVEVPYALCHERNEHLVTWPTSVLTDHLELIWKLKLSVVKVHSHPTGFDRFSKVDDESDRELAMSWECMAEDGRWHGSAVMLPDGSMFGRSFVAGAVASLWDFVQIAGHDIKRWNHSARRAAPSAHQRNLQTFGEGTTQVLSTLRVGVVGCSGTGSIVVEQLARLGVGEFVFVDPDCVEEKNLNRIVNATYGDAQLGTPKVEVMSRLVGSLAQGQRVTAIQDNLDTPKAVRAIASCDAVFGCVDTVEGRNLLNRIAAYYHVPYIDVGIQLEADGEGGISTVCGAIQYYASGMPTLLERQAFDVAKLKAEDLKRSNPDEYDRQKRERYIKGVDEDRPAVIPVNMVFASLAVMDFLSRLHSIRNMSNAEVDSVTANLCEIALSKHCYIGDPSYIETKLGLGDRLPLLDRPALSE